MSTSPLEFDSIIIPLVDGYTILDIGCGGGKWGFLLRLYWWCTEKGKEESDYRKRKIDPQAERLDGFDIFLPHLKKLKSRKIYDNLIYGDACTLPFKDNSFDVCIASEVLEHLEKDIGIKFLKEAERVSKKSVILTTPKYPGKYGGVLTVDGFNPFDQHVSQWTFKELKKRGYNVFGVGFHILGISLLSPIAKKLFGINSLRQTISFYLSPFSYKFPTFAEYYVAKKTLKDKEHENCYNR
ncbi:MAG: class I SAM-dependent methyltransferase [Proteobacteria bacterium]|nr:class I SAM-dependent methyltransferase [Pseudomonadota bacterium]